MTRVHCTMKILKLQNIHPYPFIKNLALKLRDGAVQNETKLTASGEFHMQKGFLHKCLKGTTAIKDRQDEKLPCDKHALKKIIINVRKRQRVSCFN